MSIILAFFAGGFCGVLAMCLCFMAKEPEIRRDINRPCLHDIEPEDDEIDKIAGQMFDEAMGGDSNA